MTTYAILAQGREAFIPLTGEHLGPGDSINLIEWGNYAFEAGAGGTRPPAGRICSYPYQGADGNFYIEVGGAFYRMGPNHEHRTPASHLHGKYAGT